MSASLLIVGVFAALTACGGGVRGVVNNAVCNTVPLKNTAIPVQVYPIPGYTTVPDNAAAMVVAYTGQSSLAGTITIQPAGGPSIALGPFGAAPKVMPTPFAQVQPGWGPLYGVTLPNLQSHTPYTVTYRFLTSVSLCGANSTNNVQIGSFTTI
jgi:hypothetical protein